MARPYVMTVLLLLAGLMTTGCFNSDEEYQRLVEEKDALAGELAKANHENDILNRALYNVGQEQERLQDLLMAGNLPDLPMPTPSAVGGGSSPRVNSGQSTPTAPATASTERRTYKTRPGDTLSTIANRNNTTVEKLIELNPVLQRRRNFMIYDTDVLTLP